MCLSVLRRLGAASAGVAAIEFAVLAPLLALLVVGVVDFSRGIWYQLQVASAAQAGAVYAAAQGWNATAGQIETAITGATSLPVSASPAPNWVCGCPNTYSGIAQVTCGTFCSDGSSPAHYVAVSAAASYATLLPYPGMSAKFQLTAKSYARLYP